MQTSATVTRHRCEDTLTPTEDSTIMGGRIKRVVEATDKGGACENFKDTQLSFSNVELKLSVQAKHEFCVPIGDHELPVHRTH